MFTMSSRLRAACDACHQAKVRCSGGARCFYCQSHNRPCRYSYAGKIGKPKGSRNRKRRALCGHRDGNDLSSKSGSIDSSNDIEKPSVDAFRRSTDGSATLDLEGHFEEHSGCVSAMPLDVPEMDVLSAPEAECNDTVNPDNHSKLFAPSDDLMLLSLLGEDELSFQLPMLPNESDASCASCDSEQMTQSIPSLSPSASLSVDMWEAGGHCECIEELTSSLVNLQISDSSINPDQTAFDHLLHSILRLLASTQTTLSCTNCNRDCSLILLTASSFHMVMRHLRTFLQNGQLTVALEPVHVGTYSLCPEECLEVKRMLVRRLFTRMQDTLKYLRKAISEGRQSLHQAAKERSTVQSAEAREISVYDYGYLQLLIGRLENEIRLYNRSLANLPFT